MLLEIYDKNNLKVYHSLFASEWMVRSICMQSQIHRILRGRENNVKIKKNEMRNINHDPIKATNYIQKYPKMMMDEQSNAHFSVIG